MGFISTCVKIGMVAYAVDYFYKKRHPEFPEDHHVWDDQELKSAIQTQVRSKLQDWLQSRDGYAYTLQKPLSTSADDSPPSYSTSGFMSHCHRRNRGGQFMSGPVTIIQEKTDESTSMKPSRVSIEIDVPGLQKKDLQVSVLDDERVLLVKGHSKERERSVEARVRLPKGVDPKEGSFTAKMEGDGVLRVETVKKSVFGRVINIE
ncbi:hypothetical protein HDV05_000366 [Chytridiales sp. JEL 0842]|nr:hypothetical protein HDV05_000366 [Chytridiales sp. JEL 0842]